MAIKSIVIDKFTEEKVDKNNTTEGSETYDSSSGVVKKKVGFKVTSDTNEIFIIDKFISSDLSPFLAFFAVFDFTFDLNQHSCRLSLGREVLDGHHQSKKDE